MSAVGIRGKRNRDKRKDREREREKRLGIFVRWLYEDNADKS